jgi:hypothetical protein
MSGNANIKQEHGITLTGVVGYLCGIIELPIHNTYSLLNNEGKMTFSLQMLTTDTAVLRISLFIYLLHCGLLFTCICAHVTPHCCGGHIT